MNNGFNDKLGEGKIPVKRVIKKKKKKIIKKPIETSFEDLSINDILNKIEQDEYLTDPNSIESDDFKPFEEDDDGVLIIEDDLKTRCKKWILRFLNGLRLENLFRIEDEDINSRRGVEFAIVVHLLILILVVFPYDLFRIKEKKVSKIRVSVLQMGAAGGMGATIMSDPAKLESQLPTEAKKEVIANEVVTEKRPIEKPIEEIKKQDDFAKKIEKLEKIATKKEDKKSVEDISKSLSKKDSKKEKVVQNDLDSGASSSAVAESNRVLDKFSDAGSINGVSKGEKQGGIANERNIISAAFHKYWLQTKVANNMPKDIVVDVEVYFDIEGRVLKYNIIEKKYTQDYQITAYREAKESVRDTIEACKKVDGLAKDRYALWQKVDLQFRYSKLTFN